MIAAPDAEAAAAEARAVVARASTSFYWAMRLLPRPKREAMFALYAFCRAVDDIADDPGLVEDKVARLDAWRRDLDTLYRGATPRHAIARALADPIARFALPRAPFDEVLRGMESDARGPVQAPSMAELETYCARVAGAVGLQSVRIFGCTDAHADDFALATGHALQLTNILRDIRDDAAAGRLYLPREALAAAGVEARDPVGVLRDPGLGEACAWLAERARRRYREADAIRSRMAAADAHSLLPAVIMAAIYRRLLRRIVARGWGAARAPVALGGAEKLWIALRCLAAGG